MSERIDQIYPESQGTPRPLSQGDYLMNMSRSVYILADTPRNGLMLSNIRTGRYWGDLVTVENTHKIKWAEIQYLLVGSTSCAASDWVRLTLAEMLAELAK